MKKRGNCTLHQVSMTKADWEGGIVIDIRVKKYKLVLLALLLVCYTVSSAIHWDPLANFTSVAIMAVATLYLLEAALLAGWREESPLRQKSCITWLLLAAACLTWGINDLLWAFSDLASYHAPESEVFFLYSYMLTNLFLVVAVVHNFTTLMKNWDMMQFFVDVTALLAMGLGVFWNDYLGHDVQSFGLLEALGSTTYLSLLVDGICVLFFVVILFLIPWSQISKPLKRIGLAVLIFTCADFLNVYVYFKNIYVENTLVDLLFIISLAILGSSGLESDKNISPTADIVLHFRKLHDRVIRKFWVLMLLALALSLAGKIDLNMGIMAMFIFLIHGLLSLNLQKIASNEKLLLIEQELNEMLEQKIQERTEALLQANLELELLAKLDPLTGIFNRRHFLKGFENLLGQDKTDAETVILFIDLDRFKGINDAYGHDMGDAVLMQVAERLKAWAPAESLLARLGGDEFVAVLPHVRKIEEATKQADAILKLIAEPIHIGRMRFKLSASLGISRYPTDGSDSLLLLHHADIAMYHSKDLGSNRYTFYSEHQSGRIQRRRELELLLQKLELDQELTVYYQPQFCLKTGNLMGAEALLRWNSPEMGGVSPAEFIPIAEDIDMILPIGKWVMEKAIAQVGKWNGTGHNIRMGINVSPRQLGSDTFISEVKRLIEKYQIEPQWLEIEITETSAFENEIEMVERLSVIKAMGISVAIDDFGTGYSSLSYIKLFDINRIKIAKQLVDSISEDYGSEQIVKAIVMMSDAMGLETIAEGVESQEQLEMLKKLGCNELQGTIQGHPVSAESFELQFLG